MLRILRWLKDGFDYLFGAMARIFGPDNDAYPATGVQPYDGDPYSSSWT